MSLLEIIGHNYLWTIFDSFFVLNDLNVLSATCKVFYQVMRRTNKYDILGKKRNKRKDMTQKLQHYEYQFVKLINNTKIVSTKEYHSALNFAIEHGYIMCANCKLLHKKYVNVVFLCGRSICEVCCKLYDDVYYCKCNKCNK